MDNKDMDFDFEEYSPKSMLEYRTMEILFLYMEKYPPELQIEILDIIDIWVKKYSEEIKSKLR